MHLADAPARAAAALAGAAQDASWSHVAGAIAGALGGDALRAEFEAQRWSNTAADWAALIGSLIREPAPAVRLANVMADLESGPMPISSSARATVPTTPAPLPTAAAPMPSPTGRPPIRPGARLWPSMTALTAIVVAFVIGGVVVARQPRRPAASPPLMTATPGPAFPGGPPSSAGPVPTTAPAPVRDERAAVALRWTGQTNSLTSGGVSLYEVACPSATMCIAVGERVVNGVSSMYSQALRAGTWRDVPVPSNDSYPATTQKFSRMVAVGCVSEADCWAIGLPPGNAAPRLLRYTGTRWTDPDIQTQGNLLSLTCIRGAYCLAGGQVWLRSEGSSWFPVDQPVGSGGSVSCPARDDCVALANDYAGGLVASRFDGQHWTPVQDRPIANFPTADAQGNRQTLYDVTALSCASDDRCVAVMILSQPNTMFNAIAVLGADGWSVRPADRGTQWSDAFCVNGHYCWVVGVATDPPPGQLYPTDNRPVITRFDGSQWTDATPSGVPQGILSSVTCPTATLCYAAGHVFNYVISINARGMVLRGTP